MAFIHKETFRVYNHSYIGDNDITDVDAFFEVDDIIAPIISILNIKGYKTLNCCQGHPYDILLDDIVTISPGESCKSIVHGDVKYVMPISKNMEYVFYEQKSDYSAYIMFEEGVKLPRIPEYWYIDNNELFGTHLVIRRDFNSKNSPLNFFAELINEMQKMYYFVDELPMCTSSPDEEWNECIKELTAKLSKIYPPESSIIRKLYYQGKDVDYIFHHIVSTIRD